MSYRAVPVVVLLAACSETDLNQVKVTEEFLQAPSNMVDILWIIDNSVSMLEEQENVAAGAEDFMNRFAPSVVDSGSGSAAMDFHLAVMSSDVSWENPSAGFLLGSPAVLTAEVPTYADAFRARVVVGIDGADKEKGLQAAVTALRPPLSDTANAGFLRDGAMLSIIVLSDENDCSDWGALGEDATGEDCYNESGDLAPVADFVRDLKEIKGDDNVVMSGILGPELEAGCDGAVPGRRYYTAIEMLGGRIADICSTDYSEIMDALGEVTSGILTKFQLDKNASTDYPIEVVVTPEGEEPIDVPEDEVDGWTYIAAYAQIEFHGTAVPPRGAHIEVTYVASPGPVGVAPEDSGSTASAE